MPSLKHESAISLATSRLHGVWHRKRFNRVLKKLFSDYPGGRGKTWIPDAWRINTQSRTVEVVEAGRNAEDKWDKICSYWWFLDAESWYLKMHFIDYETFSVNTLNDEEIACIVHAREFPHTSYRKFVTIANIKRVNKAD